MSLDKRRPYAVTTKMTIGDDDDDSKLYLLCSPTTTRTTGNDEDDDVVGAKNMTRQLSACSELRLTHE